MLQHALFQNKSETSLDVAHNHEIDVARKFRESRLESGCCYGEGDVLFEVIEELGDLREPVREMIEVVTVFLWVIIK